MAYYDNYVNRMNSDGNSPDKYYSNYGKEVINDKFPDSPFYMSIPIDGVDTEVRLITKEKYNEKLLLFRPDTNVTTGAIVDYADQKWMIMDYFDNSIFPKSNIQLCNTIIKWLDDNGDIQSYDAILDLPSRLQLGINQGTEMIIPDGRRRVFVQRNDNTSKIKRDQRFIIDSRAFKVTDVDSITQTGLTVLTMLEDAVNESVDNLDLGIANYTTPNFTVTILGGDNLSMKAGSTLQLQTEVRNNGTLIAGKTVSYISSDISIATVDANGLVTSIANGTVTITASLTDDSTIKETATIIVQLNTTTNMSVEIIGSDTINKGYQQHYTVTVLKNGVVDNTQRVQWYVYADDGVSATTLAQISNIQLTQCDLSGIDLGYVKLKCVLVGYSSVTYTKRIRIKSLI